MKQAGNTKRPRIRMNGGRMHTNRPNNSGNRVFDSQYPEGKIRGTAQQIIEKYLSLARDAISAGDRVKAEGFYQHADHYHRIVLASRPERPEPSATDMENADEDFEEDMMEDESPETAPKSAPPPSRPRPPSPPPAPQPRHPERPAPNDERVYVPSPRLSNPRPNPRPRVEIPATPMEMPATTPAPTPVASEETPGLFDGLPPAAKPAPKRKPRTPKPSGGEDTTE